MDNDLKVGDFIVRVDDPKMHNFGIIENFNYMIPNTLVAQGICFNVPPNQKFSYYTWRLRKSDVLRYLWEKSSLT